MTKRLVIDLDGTLCEQTTYSNYGNARPLLNIIRRNNQYFLHGWDVTIHTARGMNTHNGNVRDIESNLRLLTEKWLADNGVLYNSLVFGKPPGDMYVDDKAEKITEFLRNGDVVGSPSKIVFTNGCFDILHMGHLETLRYAKGIAGEHGMLVVGLNSDDSVRRQKGPGRPALDVETRKSVLRSLRFVDSVVVFNEDTPENLIRAIKPNVIVKGGDYRGKDVVGRDLVGVVEYAPYLPGRSTTSILDDVRKIDVEVDRRRRLPCPCLSGCKSWDCDKQ